VKYAIQGFIISMLFKSSAFAASCPNFSGEYTKEGDARGALVVMKQDTCDKILVAELQKDTGEMGPFRDWNIDGLFRESPNGNLVRFWWEGSNLRLYIIWSDKKTGKGREFNDQTIYQDLDGTMMYVAQRYNLNGERVGVWTNKLIKMKKVELAK
jgi:hypothetical protein